MLGYPAVVFTGKYADPVTLLKTASDAELTKASARARRFGIADPDVDSVEITVELQTLKMDNLESVSGRESYITSTRRRAHSRRLAASFDDELTVPLEYRDCKVLHFGDPGIWATSA